MALIGSLNNGVSALDNFAKGLGVISDNIANVNTVGFKGSTVDYAGNFSDVLQESEPAPAGSGASSTTATQIGQGVQIGAISADFTTAGTLSTTGVPTDLAITGAGFFSVRNPQDGATYVSRAGNFQLDNSGNLITSTGMRVQGLSGGKISFVATAVNGQLVYTPTITAPTAVSDVSVAYNNTIGNGLTNSTAGAFTDAQVAAGAPSLTSYSIGTDGTVNMNLSDGSVYAAGQVLLENFQNPNALIRNANNLFSGQSAAGLIGSATPTAAGNTAGTNGLGSIQSGSLELSNVDLTTQFSDLITAQRSFQAASRIVTVSDSILEEIVNLKH